MKTKTTTPKPRNIQEACAGMYGPNAKAFLAEHDATIRAIFIKAGYTLQETK